MEPTFLDLADEWATAHRHVLREAGAHWLQHGKWMTVMQLGRSALRRTEERDVFAALRELPAPLGHVADPGDTVVLRVRALAAVPQARPFLEAFVRTLGLAKLRLLADDDERPLLCSRDLTETLGMSPEAAERVSQLILTEDWMFGGSSGTPEGEWEREIDERTRAVMGVKSVEDYLQLEGQRFWSRPAIRPAAIPLAAAVVAPSPQAATALDVNDSIRPSLRRPRR